MFRTLLIFIVGGILAGMVMRLIRTVSNVLPRDEKQDKKPLTKGKIIDAEFEDLDEDS